MHVEDTKWFKTITGLLGLVGTVWLCSQVNLWPFGPRSVAGFAVFALCLFGAHGFVDMVLGMAAIVVVRDRRDSSRTRTAR